MKSVISYQFISYQSVAISEVDVRLDKPVAKFDSFDDLAFAVEVKNTTDKPIKLLDTRYGNSFGKSSGKSNSDWYSQFLFSIDVFDRDGKKLDFPEVDIVGHLTPVGSALPNSVEPGKTHRFLLRPAKWLRILSPQLKPGKYRAAIHYRGMHVEIAKYLEEAQPKHPARGA